MILQLLDGVQLIVFLVVYQIVFLFVLVLTYHARGGMMIIEYFLFCLSFPLCFCICSKQKRTAPTVLGSDRVCKFLFCLVRARHFFVSERRQILDDYFLFWQMSQTKRITVNENIRVSNSVIGITSLVPYQFREERFSS